MPSCTLLTTKDRRGRKQLASAGALNRPSKEKTAAVCGAMHCQCIVESISEEAAHRIGAFLRAHQAASHSGAFSAVGFESLSCAHADYLSISFIVVGRSTKHRYLTTRE